METVVKMKANFLSVFKINTFMKFVCFFTKKDLVMIFEIIDHR